MKKLLSSAALVYLALSSSAGVAQSPMRDSGSSAVVIIADEHDILSQLEQVINKAVTSDSLELAVVMVESQVENLKPNSKYRKDIQSAQKFGTQFYVCKADLVLYEVSESSLISKTRVVSEKKTSNVSGVYKHQSAIKQICNNRSAASK